jgi:hypothetical protein
MIPEAELYSIVVLGAMNPSIHHPSWYQLVGLIDEDEAQYAHKSGNTVTIPQIAQLEFQDFKIICQEPRWEVQTTNVDRTERLRKIAASMFDELLKHTPVSAFGVNVNYRLKTECSSVAKTLAKVITETDIGLSNENLLSAEVVLRNGDSLRQNSVSIRPTKSARSVSIAFNFNYPIRGEGIEFFRLNELIEKHFASDISEATARCERVVEHLNRLAVE